MIFSLVFTREETMNFGEAIKSGFSNYVNFSDRACRSEYWFWYLFFTIVLVVAAIVDGLIGASVTSVIWYLATILPNIAISVRRLHDLDRSGWWIFLGLIPLVGGIILLIWYCTKGTDGPNRFGADPLAAIPSIPRPQVA
jgi:uncharacterized membrane protein YhaH (DUF805 family)